ncbi:unnamed protein product [Pleuronectes platessa]|uniref:Uncharacterized protein n=1 Tax=Pleuronectes platessa TaxID=8262 RepID=A0A9N7VF99_PLEPL|nr:unnamed protein product [Pleuronectes platessa]
MSPATINSLSQAAEALPFVHTARRYYRLDGLVRSSDRPRRSRGQSEVRSIDSEGGHDQQHERQKQVGESGRQRGERVHETKKRKKGVRVQESLPPSAHLSRCNGSQMLKGLEVTSLASCNEFATFHTIEDGAAAAAAAKSTSAG